MRRKLLKYVQVFQTQPSPFYLLSPPFSRFLSPLPPQLMLVVCPVFCLEFAFFCLLDCALGGLSTQVAGRVQKMKDDGKDDYDIKKMEEVARESEKMVDDTKTRLEGYLGDLLPLLTDAPTDDPEVVKAQTAVESAKSILSTA